MFRIVYKYARGHTSCRMLNPTTHVSPQSSFEYLSQLTICLRHAFTPDGPSCGYVAMSQPDVRMPTEHVLQGHDVVER